MVNLQIQLLEVDFRLIYKLSRQHGKLELAEFESCEKRKRNNENRLTCVSNSCHFRQSSCSDNSDIQFPVNRIIIQRNQQITHIRTISVLEIW